MNNLFELQKEVRRISNQATALSASLNAIEQKIAQLGEPTVQSSDFEKIKLLATRFPFQSHPILAASCQVASIYLKILAKIIVLSGDQQAHIDQLVFLQWICTQASMDLPKLLHDANQITMQTFEKIDQLLSKATQEQLIVDSLILANFTGQATQSALEYIVNLCVICNISEENIRIFSQIAKSVLQQNSNLCKKSNASILSYHTLFSHYLSPQLRHKFIQAQRYIVVESPDSAVSQFRWKVKQQATVQKGDLIATYRKIRNSNTTTNIIAHTSGVLFQFRSNKTIYGVISTAYDNKNDIRAWILKRSKK